MKWGNFVASCYMLGMFICAYCGYIIYSTYQSFSWSHVPGYITERTKNKVLYHYEVKGLQYNSSRLRFASLVLKNWPTYDEDLTKNFVQGQKVPVFYHPNQPEFSTLRPGVPQDAYGVLSLGILLFAFGGWLAGKKPKVKQQKD